MIKRRWNIFAAIFLITLLLFQFQNCALKNPSHGGDPSPPETVANVQIVQDLSANAVAFVQTHVDVFDGAHSVTIDGLCAGTNQAILNWSLVNPAGTVFENGQVNCASGAFSVSLQKVWQWPCGIDEKLTVAPTNSKGAALVIDRKCSPELAKQLTASNDGQDLCYVELETANPVQCKRVCYHSMQVVLSHNLDAGDCKDLEP